MTTAPKLHPVRLYFKNGTSATINLPDPYWFVAEVSRQLGEATASGASYYSDVKAPLLILLQEIVFVAAVAPRDKKA